MDSILHIPTNIMIGSETMHIDFDFTTPTKNESKSMERWQNDDIGGIFERNWLRYCMKMIKRLRSTTLIQTNSHRE